MIAIETQDGSLERQPSPPISDPGFPARVSFEPEEGQDAG